MPLLFILVISLSVVAQGLTAPSEQGPLKCFPSSSPAVLGPPKRGSGERSHSWREHWDPPPEAPGFSGS